MLLELDRIFFSLDWLRVHTLDEVASSTFHCGTAGSLDLISTSCSSGESRWELHLVDNHFPIWPNLDLFVHGLCRTRWRTEGQLAIGLDGDGQISVRRRILVVVRRQKVLLEPAGGLVVQEGPWDVSCSNRSTCRCGWACRAPGDWRKAARGSTCNGGCSSADGIRTEFLNLVDVAPEVIGVGLVDGLVVFKHPRHVPPVLAGG